MRRAAVSGIAAWRRVLLVLPIITGCGSHRSSLLLERQARGPLTEEQSIARADHWRIDPVTQTKTEKGIEVTLTYASPEYLEEFFSHKDVFGNYAGLNPYFTEQMVFYVRIANKSGAKIRINPEEFVLLDDKGNQYQSIGPDYATALAEAKTPVGTLTRGVIEDARPGYFGVGLPMGRIIGKPQRRFALLKMATMQNGYLYDGVIYDGLVAFWSPNRYATSLKLLLTNIKTDFGPDDLAKSFVEFAFDMAATRKDR